MPLIGSKTEQIYREELIASHKHNFSAHSQSPLKKVLEQTGYDTKNAYMLSWVPDQSEDFFTVLIQGEFLVTVRIDRNEPHNEPTATRHELGGYLKVKGLSRTNQVRLLVAKELAHCKT
jgi:hypothetical protein